MISANNHERITVDHHDYSTDDDSTAKPHHDHNTTNNECNFDDMEMMAIEMTFSGGKQDNIVVLWGDDPTDLATKFVRKHNLKSSAIPNIAGHISTTIEQFKNSTSNITMQSPSLDDQDRSQEVSEYEDVMKKQQSNRDSNIQDSIQHEPMDLPASESHKDSQLNSSASDTADVSNLTHFDNSTIQSEGCPPEIVTPSSLLNLWAHVNQKEGNDLVSSQKASRSHFTNPSEQSYLDDSSYYTIENDSAYQFSEAQRPAKTLSLPKPKKDTHDHEQQHPQDMVESSSELRDLSHISPIKRGSGSSTGVFTAPPKSERTTSPVPRPASTRSLTSSSHDSKKYNNVQHTTDGGVRKATPQKSSAPSTPNLHSGGKSAGTSGSNTSSTPQKVSAEAFNNLKSQWAGGGNGRRKSVVAQTSGASKKEPLQQQQFSNIRDIKHRSTLVVSKAVGGTLYGASVRQPSSSDSETSSQVPSSPMKNRLYEDAFTQSKRREMLRAKAEKDERIHRQENEYRMPKNSRKITKNITRKDAHLSVSERLHEEAAVIAKKKVDRSEQWATHKENALTNWSCLQCGTYNDVKVLPLGSNVDPSKSIYTCTSCNSTYDLFTLQESMFRPTNVSMMNGTMQNVGCHRRNDNIHEYLHANTYLETKKLQLLREAWEDEDEVLTFKPIIPNSSKQILRQYLINQKRQAASAAALELENVPAGQRTLEFNSTDFDKNLGGKSKIVVAESGLESYLTLPILERLSKAETLCRVTNPGERNESPRQTKRNMSKSKSGGTEEKGGREKKPAQLSETKLNDLFSRLTYEYIDKAAKRDVARKEMYKMDQSTGKQYFQPTIGHAPAASTVCNEAPVFASDKKETIYDKLLRKGAEAKERAKLLKDKVLKKEKNDIDKNYSQPLTKSKTILKESFEQCVSEIFKLLIANQLFFQKNAVPTVEKEDNSSTIPTRDLKITAEYINEVSEKLTSFEGVLLDVRTIDPTLVLEDVQHLLTDLRDLGISNALKKSRRNETNTDNKTPSTTVDDAPFFISFEQFQEMIRQCTAKRAGGVGRSYIITPKPRDTAVKQMMMEESKECTFRPTIDSKSDELAKRKGRGESSIATILSDEALMTEQRKQSTKLLVDYNNNKECTFKPKLYAAPSHVVPTYRGQQRKEVTTNTQIPAEDEVADIEVDEDEISVMTVSTCSTTIRPPTTPLEETKKDHTPVMRSNKKMGNDSNTHGNVNVSVPAAVSDGQGEGKSEQISETETANSQEKVSADVTFRWARQTEADIDH